MYVELTNIRSVFSSLCAIIDKSSAKEADKARLEREKAATRAPAQASLLSMFDVPARGAGERIALQRSGGKMQLADFSAAAQRRHAALAAPNRTQQECATESSGSTECSGKRASTWCKRAVAVGVVVGGRGGQVRH